MRAPLALTLVGITLASVCSVVAVALVSSTGSSEWSALIAPLGDLVGVEINSGGTDGGVFVAIGVLAGVATLGVVITTVGCVWLCVALLRNNKTRTVASSGWEKSQEASRLALSKSREISQKALSTARDRYQNPKREDPPESERSSSGPE